MHCGLELLVDLGVVGGGVLPLEVAHYAFFYVLVYEFELLRTELVALVESHEVLEDVLRAVDFGLLETHIPLRVAVKRR